MSSTPINPFKDIRERAQLSQYELAKRVGVVKHSVLRLEQGMFDNPLPTLVNYFVNNYNVSRLSLISAYHQFQVETRVNTGRLLGDIVQELAHLPEGVHPLTYLREKKGYNPTSLAKALCISQSAVGYFEKRPMHQHTVPEQLMNALIDAGYNHEELEWFASSYRNYREGLIRSQSLKISPSPVGVANSG